MTFQNQRICQSEPLSLADVLSADQQGGLRWFDETHTCSLHGPFRARIVMLGDVKVSDGVCPECERLKRLADERERAKIEAQRAAEEARQRMEKALGRSCIPQDFLDKSFENFVADTENLCGALDLSKRFVKGWEKAKAAGYGLFFYGKPGTGKTHLATSILKCLMPGVNGLYTRVSDMIGYIRTGWRSESPVSAYQAARHYVDIELLVIDELGVQVGSISEQTLLFEVIDARLSENRPTIFLSNLSPSEIVGVIGERLADRIKGKCVPYCFTGKSRRRALSASVF